MPASSNTIEKRSASKVPGGNYEIGCHNIPNASPVHNRNLEEFWIDPLPVSFAHFEVFAAGHGYANDRWWEDSEIATSGRLPERSVDRRCRELRSHATKICRHFKAKNLTSSNIPLVGLNWMEAAAVCRFFGARLPFESEWEVAMTPRLRNGKRIADSSWDGFPISRWGCVIVSGTLREWTADPFSRRYWRANNDRHGEIWTKRHPLGISLRGATGGDMHTDYRFRRSADPDAVSSHCGFRRVWLEKPSSLQLSSTFARAGA